MTSDKCVNAQQMPLWMYHWHNEYIANKLIPYTYGAIEKGLSLLVPLVLDISSPVHVLKKKHMILRSCCTCTTSMHKKILFHVLTEVLHVGTFLYIKLTYSLNTPGGVLMPSSVVFKFTYVRAYVY